MKKTCAFFFALLFVLPVFSQINSADSTVQVIGYWNLHEKQTYKFTEESNQIKNGTDTVKSNKITYLVDVEILDSTANSYTIQWFYHDLQVLKSAEPVMDEILKLSDNMKMIFTTNEMGQYEGLVNWMELRDRQNSALDTVAKRFSSIPNFDKYVEGMKKQFSTKESIENSATKEIMLFYTFHGARYKLGEELNTEIKMPNMMGGEPFDGNLTVSLDTIDTTNDFYVLRCWQIADAGQLAAAAVDFVNKMASTMAEKSVTLPKNEIPPVVNELRISSQIHGSTGWPLYVYQNSDVSVGNTLQLNEVGIEIQ